MMIGGGGGGEGRGGVWVGVGGGGDRRNAGEKPDPISFCHSRVS